VRYVAKRDGFPHPVLGQRDHHWPDGRFETSVDCSLQRTPRGHELAVDARFDSNVEAIRQLVDEGAAVCALWLYCPRTSYRRLVRATHDGDDPWRICVRVNTLKLRGRTEIHPQVIAARPLTLNTQQANPAYRGRDIPVEAGAPLAVAAHFNAPLDDGDMGVQGMFLIREDLAYGYGWHVHADPQEAAVTIWAAPDTVAYFQQRRNTDWPVETVFLAALTDSLSVWLQNADRDWEDGGWGATIRRRLEEVGVDCLDGAFEHDGQHRSLMWVAQLLLEWPLRPRPEPDDRPDR